MSWAVKKLIFDKVGYEPTEVQEQIHRDEHRIKEVIGGVRAGKTTTGSGELLGSEFWLGKLYWLIGSDYDQCRPEFDLLRKWFEKLGIVKICHFPSRDQCRLALAGGIVIETKSAKYLERIAGQALDGIIMCEAAQMPYEVFTRSLERLAEKRGWLVMEGTLETSLDWYSDLFKDFQIPDNKAGGISFSLPSWSNPHAFEGGRNDPEILRLEAICGEDLFSERYGGKPVKPRGLVFPEFKSTLHVGHYPIDPKEPVFLGIDPGHYPSAYAVEFIQFIADDVYVVDEIYEQYMTTEQIATMTQQKPYYKKIEGGAIDIAAKQQDGRKPHYDIWKDMTGFQLDTKKIQPIDDGVERLRHFMIDPLMHGEPRLHIDHKCRGLMSEFGGCRTPLNPEINPSRGAWKMKMDKAGNVLGGKFEEANCDAIKGLIYEVVSRYGLATRKRKAGVTSTWV